MRIKNFILLLILALPLIGNAQIRKYSNDFLSIGVGAKSLAMGNATVASVNDVTAGYWNPAGLNAVEDNLQIGLMHSEYFAGIAKFDYGSVAIPVADGDKKIGFSMIRFAVDDIANTLFLIGPDGSINYDNITTFSVADYAFLFSYAQPIKWKNLHVGANAKVIHRTAGSFATAWGFGLDVGAQLTLNKFRIGLMARDITTTFNAWSFSFTEEEKQILTQTNNAIPENSYELTAPKVIAGVAYKHNFGENFSLLGELNLDFTTDGRRNTLISADPVSIDPHAGLEVGFRELVFVRAGAGNIQQIKDFDESTYYTLQPNVGVGLNIKNISIDYAYTDIGKSESIYSHVFSVKVGINKRSE